MSIYNETNDRYISGSDYGDDVENRGGARVTIAGGNGDDNIQNNARVEYNNWSNTATNYRFPDSSSINAGAGNDYIKNVGNDSVLLGGEGKDTILNVYRSGSHDRTFYSGMNVTIYGGKGNDSIQNEGDRSIVDGGAGNDFLYNGDGFSVVITGGKGNDSIINWGYHADINGGSGKDTIEIWGLSPTIAGGKGNDVIKFHAENGLIQYSSGDGNDKIYGFNETSTLQIGDGKGTYSLAISGDNLIVTVGKDKITIVGGADLDELHIDGAKLLTVNDKTKSPVTIDADIKFIDASKRTTTVKITGNALANSIVGGSNKDTLYGGYGADTLTGGAGNDKLFGDAGNDSLLGGDGKDTLSGGSGKDKLIGGAGNDSLWGGKGNDTLIGGKGNDIFIYKPGEGTDHITDYAFASSKLTLTISGGGKVIFDNVSAGDVININDKKLVVRK